VLQGDVYLNGYPILSTAMRLFSPWARKPASFPTGVKDVLTLLVKSVNHPRWGILFPPHVLSM